MRHDLLTGLRCSYTGSRVELTAVGAEANGEIEYGVVTTDAGEFPIVAGVLRLLPDDLQEPIVGLVRDGRHDAALMAALEMPFSDRWRDLGNRALRVARKLGAAPRSGAEFGKRRLYDLVSGPHASFAALAERANARRWTNWQTYRFSMAPFLPVYALAHLARGCRTILDFGCGLGHSSFLLRRLAGDATVVCADYSFTSMYLARKYLVPGSPCICLDGDFQLPFRAGAFDLVFSTDALQYIEAKRGLAGEFERVLAAQGTIALAHLHNRRSSVRAGKSLTAAGYDRLFEGMSRHLYPEDDVVDGYVRDGSLDLGRRYRLDEVDRALNGLSLVAARSEAAFTRHDGLCDAYIDAMQHPAVNPAYRVPPTAAGTVELARGVGSPWAVERRIVDCEILPATWRVGLPSLDARQLLALRDTDRPQLRELVRRFLVLELPQAFA